MYPQYFYHLYPYLLCGVELGEDPVHLPLHCRAPLHTQAGRQVAEKH